MKPEVRIEDWAVVCPWDGTEILVGRSYGHPYIDEGAITRTSKIIKKDIDNGYIETLNTIYKLGKKRMVAVDAEQI